MNESKRIIEGIDIDALKPEPVKKLAEISRKVAAEGAVLLKNENMVLPFAKGEIISVFGRSQFEYLKSGTGSGGRVNTEYTVNIMEGLINKGLIKINTELSNTYKSFIKENPFDSGVGWADEPWSQKEMPITAELAENAAKLSDKALIIISRLCGESRDNTEEAGGYLLQPTEYEMIKTVRKAFKKVCVVLNTGNIMDSGWIDELAIDSAMYVWQGGQEGGNAVADLLCGSITPSGKLSDTIVKSIVDYPSNNDFGNEVENYYTEDIYVGYRYFETFAKDTVLYPFGFGLSYTTFSIEYSPKDYCDNNVTVVAKVKNTGAFSGAEVVQVYYEAPQGKLGKPLRQLGSFAKTPVLKPGESCTLCISFNINDMASYDDSGITGNKSCYVLEAGEYIIYAGTDVRIAKKISSVKLENSIVTEKLTEALAPVKTFKRLVADISGGSIKKAYADVPKRTIDLAKRIEDNRHPALNLTGNCGLTLKMVADKECTMDEFVAQLTPDELACLFCGEGMCSPKVKSGTGGAIGGLTDELLNYGIPVACVTDGPSGLRFDSGEKATSMPCGTLIACTWNTESAEELFIYEGMECYAYGVDSLLGPGINIHRHPLNGRNFEYFSEDPLLTGKFATAIVKGLSYCNVTGTIKHFACNNQEFDRFNNDSVVSERALREIYLKPFQLAVESGYTGAIMTSYNKINGIHANSNFDLCTTILKNEWKYSGLVMTDWWPLYNDDGCPDDKQNRAAMVRAQNDVAMVMQSAATHEDNIMECYSNGTLPLYDMQRNAKNILQYIVNSNSLERALKNGFKTGYGLSEKIDTLKLCSSIDNIEPDIDYELNFDNSKPLLLEITAKSPKATEVQTSINIYNNAPCVNCTINVNGSNNNEFTVLRELMALEKKTTLKFSYNIKEVQILKLKIMQ